MEEYSELSPDGSVLFIFPTAVSTAAMHADSPDSTQSCMTSANPTSFPPAVTLTNEVDVVSDPSWLPETVLVVAPEQATKVNDDGEFAAAQRYG